MHSTTETTAINVTDSNKPLASSSSAIMEIQIQQTQTRIFKMAKQRRTAAAVAAAKKPMAKLKSGVEDFGLFAGVSAFRNQFKVAGNKAMEQRLKQIKSEIMQSIQRFLDCLDATKTQIGEKKNRSEAVVKHVEAMDTMMQQLCHSIDDEEKDDLESDALFDIIAEYEQNLTSV